MIKDKMSIYDFLTSLPPSKVLVILEGFRVAVNDADTYDMLAEQMDLSDEEMFEVRKLVQLFLDDDKDIV